LQNFKNSVIRVLVATDIAARGIDVDDLTHVINYELPEVPETYVHRIGRTGRAGNAGIALAFCDSEEKLLLRDIQKLTGKQIPVRVDHPYPIATVQVELKEPHQHKFGTNTPKNHAPKPNKKKWYGGKPAAK
jgi:ATP-dependent RNA helicase RhlE